MLHDDSYLGVFGLRQNMANSYARSDLYQLECVLAQHSHQQNINMDPRSQVLLYDPE